MKWESIECAKLTNTSKSSEAKPKHNSERKWRKIRLLIRNSSKTCWSRVSSKWWRDSFLFAADNQMSVWLSRYRQMLLRGIENWLWRRSRDSRECNHLTYHATSSLIRLIWTVLRTTKHLEFLVASSCTLRRAELCVPKQLTTGLICVSRLPFQPSGTCFSHRWGTLRPIELRHDFTNDPACRPDAYTFLWGFWLTHSLTCIELYIWYVWYWLYCVLMLFASIDAKQINYWLIHPSNQNYLT